MDFPIRINKYLAEKQIATRRGADNLIRSGNVKLNGKRAELGDIVHKDDHVEVVGRVRAKPYTYLAYHKPKGVITHSPQFGEKSIKDMISPKKLFPVGRLDKQSHGLIILTDDGRITERLLSPHFEHEKEYLVSVNETLRQTFAKHMSAGVDIGGYHTKKCTVRVQGPHTFSIILTEGKKHQIRKMCETMHVTVADLKRVRIMNIKLGNLPPNSSRPIKGAELATFLQNIGMQAVQP